MLAITSSVEVLRDVLNSRHESSNGNSHVKSGAILNLLLKQGLIEQTFKPAHICRDVSVVSW